MELNKQKSMQKYLKNTPGQPTHFEAFFGYTCSLVIHIRGNISGKEKLWMSFIWTAMIWMILCLI